MTAVSTLIEPWETWEPGPVMARDDTAVSLRKHLLGEIAFTRALIAQLEEQLHSRVQATRDAGATWQELAEALGVSAQAAQQRFRRR